MDRLGRLLTPSMVLALMLTGCHGHQSRNQAQAQTPSGEDPAAVNLAPAGNSGQNTGAENPPAPPPDQQSQPPAQDQQEPPSPAPYSQASGDQYPPPPADQYAGDYGNPADDSETDEDIAPEPPPPIPEYEQPPAPGDDYEWTPGYWAYAPVGYYWVPGAWLLAPWIGALWTPGYWGFDRDRYRWYPGYWGDHVGFYGGINYGSGYDGRGYEGGYWRDRHFCYNRAVTRVDNRVHNVYDYRIPSRFNHSRVSYNGGRGGLSFRPSPAEAAARNERHTAALPAQRVIAHNAMRNRGQFAQANHGRPQIFAENRPLNGGRSAPAARPQDFHPAPAARPERQGRPMAGVRPAPGIPLTGPHAAAPARPQPERRPAPQPHNFRQPSGPENPPPPEARPEFRPEARPAPRPAPPPSFGPAPRPHPEARPTPHAVARPQPQTRPEFHPVPQGRPAAGPPPRTRPPARPAPPRQEQRPAHPQERPNQNQPR